MNKTLAAYMTVASMLIILVSLYYGLTFHSLQQKHESDVNVIESFQINKL